MAVRRRVSSHKIRGAHPYLMFSRNEIASIPLLPITVCFSFGIILYVYGFGLISAIILIIAAFSFLFRRPDISVFFVATLLGLCQSYVFIPLEPNSTLIDRQYIFSGVIYGTSQSETAQSVVVHVDSAGNSSSDLCPIAETAIAIVYPDFSPEFNEGERIVFRCRPQKVSATYDLPDEIDPAEFLIKKHIYLRSIITADDIFSISPPSGFYGFMLKLRNGIKREIYRIPISSDSKELLAAMLTGESQGIDSNMRESFRKSGLSHILAISGLHVGIIALMVSLSMWPLYFLRLRYVRWVVTIVIIWLFAFITGLAPSVTRAAIMTSTYFMARLLQRNTSPLNSLCLAALIILLFNPASLFDVGFQLSFAAVISILIFAGRLNPVSPRRKLPHAVVSYITVSTSAMLGTGLISALYFHSFPIYFLISNVLISLVLPIFLGIGILIVFLTYIGLSFPILASSTDFIANIITGIGTIVANLPGSSIDNIYLPAYVIIPFIIFLLGVKLTLDNPDRKHVAASFILLAVFIICIVSGKSTPRESKIYMSRDFRHTELIICSEDPVMEIITNTPNEPMNIMERAKLRYKHYIGKRGIKEIRIDTTNCNSDRMIMVGNKKIALVSGKKSTFAKGKINYIVISKGFLDEIEDIKGSYTPDTIIISSDIHPVRAARYIKDCRLLEQPYIWTRTEPWSITYSSSSKPILK